LNQIYLQSTQSLYQSQKFRQRCLNAKIGTNTKIGINAKIGTYAKINIDVEIDTNIKIGNH
jgi:UDP-3-O-[3-hydroxymyristoyl] glucosamine N-acyltransferase